MLTEYFYPVMINEDDLIIFFNIQIHLNNITNWNQMDT